MLHFRPNGVWRNQTACRKRGRSPGDRGDLLKKITELGYGSPLQKINQKANVYIVFLHPTTLAAVKLQPNYNIYSCPYYLSVLSRKLEAWKQDKVDWNSWHVVKVKTLTIHIVNYDLVNIQLYLLSEFH